MPGFCSHVAVAGFYKIDTSPGSGMPRVGWDCLVTHHHLVTRITSIVDSRTHLSGPFLGRRPPNYRHRPPVTPLNFLRNVPFEITTRSRRSTSDRQHILRPSFYISLFYHNRLESAISTHNAGRLTTKTTPIAFAVRLRSLRPSLHLTA